MDAVIVQSRGQISVNLEASDKIRDYEVSNDTSTKNTHEADLTLQPLDENLKVDTISTENLCDGNSNRKKKKRRKSKKAIAKDERQRLDQTKMDTGLIRNLAEGNATVKKPKVKDDLQIFCQTEVDTGSSEDLAEGNVTVENTEFLNKVECTFLSKIDPGVTVNTSEGNVTGKRTRKRKRIVKAEIEDEVRNKMDAINLAGGNATTKKRKIKDEVQNTDPTKIGMGSTESPAQRNMDIENPKTRDESQSMYQTNLDNGSAQSFTLGIVAGKRKKEKGKKKKKPVDEVQKEMDARLIENLDEGKVTIEKPKVKDEPQSLGQTQMNKGPTEHLADGNIIIDNPKIQDEAQSMDQQEMDTLWPAENLAQGNMTGKRRKKRKEPKNAKINDEHHSEMNTRSTENLSEENVVIANLKIQDVTQSMDQNKMHTWQPAENLAQGNVPGKQRKKRKKMKKAKFNDEVHGEMHTRSIENLAEGNAAIKKPEIKDEVQSVYLAQMDTGSTENVAEGHVTIKNLNSQDEIQSIYQTKMDTGPTQNFDERNVTLKKKKKRKRTKKAKTLDEVPGRMDAGSTENLAGVIVSIRTPETRDEVRSMGLKVMDAKSAENLSKGSVTIDNPKNKDDGQRMDKIKVDTEPSKDFTVEHVNGNRKRRRRSTRNTKNVGESTSQGGTILSLSVNGSSQVSNKITLDEGIGHAEPRSAISTCNAFTLKDVEALCLKTAPIASTRRKLIVLDLNGLLADIVYSAPKHCKGDTKISGRAVFKRPFCDDFLKFCFENFDVGIWSSRSKYSLNCTIFFSIFITHKTVCFSLRLLSCYSLFYFPRGFFRAYITYYFWTFSKFVVPHPGLLLLTWTYTLKPYRKIVDKVVDYLLEDRKDKLQFCWDMMHSTQTGFKTLENNHKPLVCKELRKIWENDDPSCPWKKGDYDESNTLLLDDSPYKALLNPLHTAIFPCSYQYFDKNDNSLGPGGDLRVYLEGLVISENVQKYVEQHPFGQRPITEKNLSWGFYKKVLNHISNPVNGKTPIPS